MAFIYGIEQAFLTASPKSLYCVATDYMKAYSLVFCIGSLVTVQC